MPLFLFLFGPQHCPEMEAQCHHVRTPGRRSSSTVYRERELRALPQEVTSTSSLGLEMGREKQGERGGYTALIGSYESCKGL